MDDVPPALHEAIEKDFRERIGKDSVFQTLYRRVKKAGATHADAAMLAERTGQIGADVLKAHLTEDALPDGRLYFNIAQRTIAPALEDVHEVADAACVRVQNQRNRVAGIGIKALSVPADPERIRGIVSAAAEAPKLEVAHRLLEAVVPTYAQHVTDESVRRNADFQYRAGLSPKIVRKAPGNPCPRCAGLAGVYNYADVSDSGNDVFRRHNNCRCTVEFDPGGGKRQNAHTKQWTGDTGRDKIEARKAIGLAVEKSAGQREIEFALKNETTSDAICQTFISHHETLGRYTPSEMKDLFEQMGYTTLPLGRGSFKGIPFEDGGGYRVSFGGDGIFQYHAAKRSHHGGAYWKVSNGKYGTRRFDLDGPPKPD